jgi:hypothetical protein
MPTAIKLVNSRNLSGQNDKKKSTFTYRQSQPDSKAAQPVSQ